MSTYSIEEMIRIEFDKFFDKLKYEDMHVCGCMSQHLKDLEENCIVEASSDYTTEMEEAQEDSYDRGLETGHENGYDEGIEEGYSNGVEDGHQDGYQGGYSDGNSDGYHEGYAAGIKISNETMNRAISDVHS